jgi:uncharacterized protein
LARSDLCRADINVLADRLARFFATARRVDIRPTTYLDRLRAECRASWHALESSGGPELQQPSRYLVRRIEAFIHLRKDLLLRRLEDGRLMEGHGDLRPEHIYLGSTPTVIDCLEFRPDLRLLSICRRFWLANRPNGRGEQPRTWGSPAARHGISAADIDQGLPRV